MKKIKLLLMLLLVTVFAAQAQTTPSTLTLYDGTTTNQYVPVYGNWVNGYQRIQFVMPDEDLTAMVGKTIEGMTFYYETEATTVSFEGVGFEVYMKGYDQDKFDGTAYIDMSDATMVYSGGITLEDNEMTVEFTELYDYYEGNLLIEFRVVEPGSSVASLTFLGVDKRDASIWGYSAGSVNNINYGTQQNFLPKTTFTYSQYNFYELTATADPEGAATFEGTGSYREGSTQSLTANAKLGFEFINWTLNDVEVSTDPTIEVEMTGNLNYVAHFDELVVVQGEVTVHNGTNTHEYVPFYGWYADETQIDQMIYPASDLTAIAGKPISKMVFYIYSQSGSNEITCNWIVSMGITNATSLSGIDNTTPLTEVYYGPMTFDLNTMTMTIEFDQPFTYEGGNLLVQFNNPVTSTNSYHHYYFYGETVTGASYTYNGQRNFLPKTTFSYAIVGHGAEVSAVVNPEEAGTVEGTGTQIIGQPCTLTATANDNYVFVNWTDEDDEEVSANAAFTFTVAEDVTYTANFELAKYNITASAYPPLAGEVEGAGEYEYGSTCTLTATANPELEYHFVNWTLNDEVVSEDAEYTFTIEGDAEYVANFYINEFTVTASTNIAGGIVEGAGVYEYGDECTLMAYPFVGYNFINWTLEGEEVSTEQSISFPVEEDIEFVANFEQFLFFVDIEIEGDDDAYVSGWGYYEEGDEVTVFAAPSSYYYYFINWTDKNGEELSTENEYTFEIGTANDTLVANFGSYMTNEIVVTVHDGEETNSYVPFYGYYTDETQRNQMIYPASDFEEIADKSITEMAFYFDYGQDYQFGSGVGNWIISLGETDATTLDELDLTTELNVVYEGGLDAKFNYTTQILTITFDVPYTYNGGNLLVEFNHPQTSSYKDYVFYGETVEGASYTYNNQRNFLPKTTFKAVDIEPIVNIAPALIQMAGYQPNNAWMEADATYQVTVINLGGETTVDEITVTNDYFGYDLGENTLPYTLGTNETLVVTVTRGVGEGEETGDMVITCGENELTVALSATAYDPAAGDVWETAIEVEFDENGEYENQLPVADNLYWNYNLWDNYNGQVDAVYKVTFENEVWLQAGSNGNNAQTLFYTEDFKPVYDDDPMGGPTWYNYYYYNGPKYVETRGNRDNNDFINETFDGEEMPENWSDYSEWGMNSWTLDTENHYVKCSHNINAGEYLQGNTWLVTPIMNLSNETNVVLTLKYMNKQWDNDIDEFGVYYRNYWGDWVELMYTAEAHETWTEVEIAINNEDYYFSDVFQFGFVMNDNYGYGVAIDDVTVTGYRLPDYQNGGYFPAGTYYVVFATTDEEFQQVNMKLTDVPAPNPAYAMYPEDNATGVAIDASVEPIYGWYTEEMQILYGVTNPPTDTLVDWTDQLYAAIPFENLQYNKKYYVQINSRNIAGETEGNISSFRTICEGVENFLVDNNEVYSGLDTLTFTWDAAEGALGYNVYWGYYDYEYEYWYYTNKANYEIITTTEFQYPADYLWMNMDGFDFYVTAVYKYGESAQSDLQRVYISGLANYVGGYVYELDGYTPIEGVSVAMTCIDEFENEHVYEVTTDEDGMFEFLTDLEEDEILYVGDYSIEVTKEGYQTVTEEFDLGQWGGYYPNYTLTEDYIPVTNVVATIIDGDTKAEVVPEVAHITWEYESLDRSLQGFNIYRTSAYNNGPYTVENTEVIALGVEETEYDDDTWAALAEQGEGTYKYGVAAVYAGNAPQQTRDIVYAIQEDFENGLPEGWTTIDADGDGYDWFLGSTYPNNSNFFTNRGHNGSYDMMVSSSYDNNINSALHPDNYLVTPQVKLQGTFGFYATCYSTSWGAEHFGIALSTDGVNFTTIDEWTLGSKGGATGGPRDRGDRAQGAWGYYSINLDETSFAGQTGYIAIRHFNCTDQYYLEIDDVELYCEYTPLFVDGMSEIEWSNPLDINMEIEDGVDITVELNNGASPEGIQVTLTNIGNGDVYEVTLDEDGYYAWETFRRGDYLVNINVENYAPVEEEVSIWAPTNLEYTLAYNVELVISAYADPEDYGNAWVARGNYTAPSIHWYYGETAKIQAEAYDEKEFVVWTTEGEFVSRNNPYEFTVKEEGDYVAHFRTIGDNYYEVENPEQYANNMSIIGVIHVDGELQNNLDLEVGAFVGDECRGGARLDYYDNANAFLVFLTVYGEEDGEVVEFYLYDHGMGEETGLSCVETVAFEADAVLGTPIVPYVFNFVAVETQFAEFAEGWNWWSTYVELNNGLELLETGLGESGVMIKNNSAFAINDEGDWSGTLMAINNEEMFKVQVTEDVEVELRGQVIDPEDHPITLGNGWTYLGFISDEPMSLEEAFINLEPTQGDVIKSQSLIAIYDEEFGWEGGTLNTLVPGAGYMYMSNNEEEVTFTYPIVNRAETEANIVADNNHWVANVHAYANNMTVIAVVELNNEEVESEAYELAVFANGECRGSVRLININDRYIAFLPVSGDETAELNFGLYNAVTGMETFDSQASLSFSANALVGSMREPVVISFKGNTGIDEHNGDFMMYPNPTEKGGYVRMVMSNETTRADVEIINSLGQVVSVQTATQMPASILVPEEAGVYTVRIVTEGKNVKCHKLIVK